MLYVNPLESYQVTKGDETARQISRRKQSLQEYERLFVYQMLREMRKTVTDSGLFGDSREQGFYQEILDDVLAGEMAKSGQLGIAKQIEAQLMAAEQSASRAKNKLETKGLPLRPQAVGMPLSTNKAFPVPERTRKAFSFNLNQTTGIALKNNA